MTVATRTIPEIILGAGTYFVGRQSNPGNGSSVGSGAFVNDSSISGNTDSPWTAPTIPANFLTDGRVLDIELEYELATGSAPPNLFFALKIGSTQTVNLGGTAGFTPVANISTSAPINFWLKYRITAMGAPSGSVGIRSSAFGPGDAFSSLNTSNNVAQSINFATNSTLAVQGQTKWSAAGTGINVISVKQMLITALN